MDEQEWNGEPMSVRELNRDQLDELKHAYYYEFDAHDHYRGMDYWGFWWSIPDEDIYQAFEDVSFVPDDFFCTAGVY